VQVFIGADTFIIDVEIEGDVAAGHFPLPQLDGLLAHSFDLLGAKLGISNKIATKIYIIIW